MRRTLPLWMQLIGLVVVLGGAAGAWLAQDSILQAFPALAGRSQQDGGARRTRGDAVPVVVDQVTSAANDTVIEAIASARARRSVTLVSDAAGEVVQVAVAAGDRIEAGAVIVQLDTTTAQLAVDMARVQVAAAETKLLRAGHLRDRNVSSQATVEDATVVLDQAKVALRQAEDALSKRTLRAPFAGVVGIPKVDVGDRIDGSTPVITIDDRSEMIVEVAIPERYLASVVRGAKVTGRTPGYPGRAFEGQVDRIDSRIDPATRSVTMRASLPNGDDLLRPGMSFALTLAIAGQTYPQVPELALQWAGGESYVWRVRDGAAEKVVVRSVRRLNETILVEGSLEPGDKVVVEGVQRLRPGRQVQLAEPPPAATAQGEARS